MSRTDRLFDLMQILRDGRLHRAQDMAEALNVSVRTIYRDMDTLIASGFPVEGERGVGYITTAPVTLPPLNLTMRELEALHLGMAVVAEAADDALQEAARTLSAKIDAALPEDRTAPPQGWGLAVYPFADASAGYEHLPLIRTAIRARQKLRLRYEDDAGAVAERTIRPLRLDYWGRIWTTTAWCEHSDGFEVFRMDRVRHLDVLPELFLDEPGRTLEDYLAQPENRKG